MERTNFKNKVNAEAKDEHHKTQTKKYSPAYWQALFYTYAELNRVLYNGFVGYEERQYFYELEKEEFYKEEKELVSQFESWSESVVDDGLELSRILNLNNNTKKWLKKKCKNWDYWLQKAKDAILISNTTKGQVNYRLGQLTVEVLINNFPALYNELGAGFDEGWNEESYFHNIENAFRVFFLEEFPDSQDNRFLKVKKEVIKRKRKELEEVQKYLDQFEPTKKKAFPYQWILNNQAIMENLNKKGNRHFLKIYEMLMEQRIKYSASTFYFDAYAREDKLRPVLVKPNLDSIQKGTGCDFNTIRRYIREMIYQGILVKFVKDGEHGQIIYQIGEWAQGKAAFPKPVWFLKNNKKMKEALKDFDTNRPLKKQGSQK